MTDGGYTWGSEPEKELYKKAVRACLDDPRLTELLAQRPTVTVEAVVEAMCSSPYVERALDAHGLDSFHAEYKAARRINDSFRWALPERLSLRGVQENKGFLPWCAGVLVFCLLTGTLFLSSLPPYVILGIPVLLVLVPALAFARPSAPSPPAPDAPGGWLRAVRLALLGPATLVLSLLEWRRGLKWVRYLHVCGLQRLVTQAVEELIGDDLGTLLVTSSDEGLRSHHQRSYLVSSHSTGELRRKMDQLADGTIAVSGPRGVGKTTLMQSAVRPQDFSVFAHAPAAYTPYEFLISLFVSVCRGYITRAGHDAPELVRLSYLHRVRRTVVEPLRGLLRLLPYALLAALLVGLGLFAATKKSVEAEHGVWGWRFVTAASGRLGDFVQDVLHGRAPEAAFAVTLVGGLLWSLRRSRSFALFLRRLGKAVVALTGAGLLVGPIVSLAFDPAVRHHFFDTAGKPLSALFGSACLLALAWTVARNYYMDPAFSAPKWQVGPWSVNGNWCLGLLIALAPFLILALIAADETTRFIVTDDETPFRVGAMLLGFLIVKLQRRSWSLPRLAPTLVADCRDHLYRLQTVQNSTAGMTTGATQFLALGTNHTSGLTSVPPNYPLLVTEFRELLGRIAQDEHHNKGNRVIIVIDEVDRLGTDTQALAFLAEIKGILGVLHVHYLISVAEDVGAAFVRRGLPNRDVTDSSLDDVLHVGPGTLGESTAILRRRAPGIGDPYIALAHALSGGIPRDLIRYGRRLVEIRTSREQVELQDVAQALITEELSETLAGFRTLLAKQEWERDTMGVLGSFRSLAAHLRVACPCPEPVEQLRGALAHFVAYEVANLPDESRRLINEAAAYAYFSLTLLDVFGRADFNRRRAEAARRPDGYLDLLAEARQELGVSPYSARVVIDDIRRAWGLTPVFHEGPGQPTAVIPPPRFTACTRDHASP